MPVKTQIQIRRDTAANWRTTNPTLAAGEMGYDTTNGVLKVGDGATAWTSLAATGQLGVQNTSFRPISGSYYTSTSPTSGAITFTTANVSYYTPFFVPYATTFDRIGIRTTGTFSGTASIRLGIYNCDISTTKPSTVVVDAGTLSATAANTSYEITISQSLAIGWYFLVANPQTLATTTNLFALQSVTGWQLLNLPLTGNNGFQQNIGWQETGVTGAFATAGTVTLTNTLIRTTVRVV